MMISAFSNCLNQLTELSSKRNFLQGQPASHSTACCSNLTYRFSGLEELGNFLKTRHGIHDSNILLSLSHNFRNFFLPDTFLLSLETSLTSRYSEIKGDLSNINPLLLPR